MNARFTSDKMYKIILVFGPKSWECNFTHKHMYCIAYLFKFYFVEMSCGGDFGILAKLSGIINQKNMPAVVGHPPQTHSTHLVLQEHKIGRRTEEYACRGWSFSSNQLDSSCTASWKLGAEQKSIPGVVGHPPKTNSTHLVLKAEN